MAIQIQKKALFIFVLIFCQTLIIQPHQLSSKLKRSKSSELQMNSNLKSIKQHQIIKSTTNSNKNKVSLSLKYSTSRSKTRVVFFLLFASIVLDVATMGVKLFTWAVYTRKIEAIKSRLNERLLDFYRAQLDIKRRMCFSIRRINSVYMEILTSVKIQLFQAGIIFKSHVYMNKESVNDAAQNTNKKLILIAWGRYLSGLNDNIEMVDSITNFQTKFQNMVCSYSIDLAGENIILKSKLASLIPPKNPVSPTSKSELIKGAIFDFLMFWVQTTMLGSMDAVNSQGQTSPITDGKVDVSSFSDRNTDYGNLVGSTTDNSIANFNSGSGMYSSTPDGMVMITEACLGDVIGFCNPAAMIETFKHGWELIKKVTISASNMGNSWEAKIVFLSDLFSACVFFGMYFFKWYKFIEAILLGVKAHNTANSAGGSGSSGSASFIRTMMGWSRAPYNFWFDALDSASALFEGFGKMLSLNMELKILEKKGMETDAYLDKADEMIVLKDDMVAKVLNLVGKGIIMILLPIAYRGILTFLKYMGGPFANLVMLALAAVKVVMSLKSFVESVVEMNKKRKELKGMKTAEESDKNFFEKLTQIIIFNSAAVECKYYFYLHQIFTKLSNRFIDPKTNALFLEESSIEGGANSEMSKLFSSMVEDLTKQSNEITENNRLVGKDPDYEKELTALDTLDPQGHHKKTNQEITDIFGSFDKKAHRKEIFDFFNDLCTKQPYFCLRMLNSQFFHDLVTNHNEIEVTNPPTDITKNEFYKVFLNNLYYITNFGPISNVDVIPGTEVDQAYIGKNYKDNDENEKKEKEMSYNHLNYIYQTSQMEGYHVLHLGNFKGRAMLRYTRGVSSGMAAINMGIRFVKKDRSEDIIKYQRHIRNFSDHNEKLSKEAYDYTDEVTQTEFITGQYDSEAEDPLVDDFTKVTHFMVAIILYSRIEVTNDTNTIPLLQSVVPTFKKYENDTFKNAEDAILVAKATISFNNRVMWNVKTTRWSNLPEPKPLSLIITDFTNAINYDRSKLKPKEEEERNKKFLGFCNDYISIRHTGKTKGFFGDSEVKKSYVMYIGITNEQVSDSSIKDPLKVETLTLKSGEKFNMDKIGTFSFSLVKLKTTFKVISEHISSIGDNLTVYTMKNGINLESTSEPVYNAEGQAMAFFNGSNSKEINDILQFTNGISIKSAINRKIVTFGDGTQNQNQASSESTGQDKSKVDWSVLVKAKDNLKAIVCSAKCYFQAPIVIPNAFTEIQPYVNEDGPATGGHPLDATDIDGFTGIKTALYIMYEIKSVPTFVTPIYVNGLFDPKRFPKVKKKSTKEKSIQFINTSFAMGVGGAFSEIIQEAIKNRKMKNDLENYEKLKKSSSFFHSNFLETFMINEKVEMIKFWNTPKASTPLEAPNFMIANRTPYFSDLRGIFFSRVKSVRTGQDVSLFFLHQSNIGNVKDGANVKGKNVFNLDNFWRLQLDKFNVKFFFPILKRSTESFINEQVSNCDISPESALAGIKYYQLTTATYIKRGGDDENKKATAQLDKSKKTDGIDKSKEASDNSKDKSNVQHPGTKGDVPTDDDGLDEEDESDSQENANEESINGENGKFVAPKMTHVSRIPKSDLAYVEFEMRKDNNLDLNMNIPNDDINTKILLERNYIPYFPSLDNEISNESDKEAEVTDDIPANLYYAFKYKSDFFMTFRLWVHYAASMRSKAVKTLCGAAPKNEKQQLIHLQQKKKLLRE